MARFPDSQPFVQAGLEQRIAYLQMGSSYILACLARMLTFRSNSHIMINLSKVRDTALLRFQMWAQRRESSPFPPVTKHTLDQQFILPLC
jgi:hypothetical protein